jgi:hypothetical protein
MARVSISWERQVLRAMQGFASKYAVVYSKKDRELAAHFEIGCLLALIEFYEESGFTGKVQNPDEKDGSYNYLTTPNGNPARFSYMLMSKSEEVFEIRQQVRIVSHIGDNIAFTPDIIVVPAGAEIKTKKDSEYASGKRRFFYVTSDQIVAAHECKSLMPFPELLISFIGVLVAGHAWIDSSTRNQFIDPQGDHLAPSLFVGGTARALHIKMIKGLKDAFPMNIIVGMHSGTWSLNGEDADVRRIRNPLKC